MQAASGEREAVSLLRPRLWSWLGSHGRDPRVIEQARLLADAYLADPASVDPSLAGTALALAAENGDAGRFAIYVERFEQAKLPADRERFLVALGSFRDTTLISKALDYALSGPLRPQEISTVIRTAGRLPENESGVFEWTIRNYDRIAARTPPNMRHNLVYTAGSCWEERLERGRAFFSDPAHQAPGMDKDLARLSDQVRDCVSLRAREGESVARYLNGLSAAR